jgi:hypothetical protein
MATFSRQHTAACVALAALFLGGTAAARTEDQSDSGITILVYDYAGVQADTLLKSEQETIRIFRHSGVDIIWRHCRMPGASVPLDCPDPSPLTPALRLVPRFQLVGDRVHAEAMGYSTGDFATVSVDGGIGRCATPADPRPNHGPRDRALAVAGKRTQRERHYAIALGRERMEARA